MGMRNSTTRYGGITKTFHWLTAILIFMAFPLGIIANGLPFENGEEIARKAWMFSLHKSVGVTVFIVAVLRILWALGQTKPALLNGDNRLEAFAAETVHWLLYASLVIVPLSGWIHHASTTGFAPLFLPFGDNLPGVPKSETLAGLTSGIHIVFTKVLLVAVLAHVGGALKHFVIDRDKTLQRMLPGTPELPEMSHEPHSRTPMFAALFIAVLAVGGGTYLAQDHGGAHDGHLHADGHGDDHGEDHSDEHSDGHGDGDHSHAPSATAVDSAAAGPNQWAVQSGTLAISVDQFGSPVTGAFEQWNAAIEFAPTADANGRHGAVSVDIVITSLTLGSVTDQALGADYFDAATHGSAQFVAEIFAAEAGFVARGDLTLRGVTKPLELSFTLDIVDGAATMKGTTTIERLPHGIGTSTRDPSTLGLGVDVTVDLVAKALE